MGGTPRWKRRIRVTVADLPLNTFSAWLAGVSHRAQPPDSHPQTHSDRQLAKELNGYASPVISDIHTAVRSSMIRKLQQIVATTRALNPDLIVLLGDSMSPTVGTVIGSSGSARGFEEFASAAWCLFSPGNHDWWYSGEKVRAAFEQNGIRVLEMRLAEVSGRTSLSGWLGGDLWTRAEHINQTMSRKVPPGSPSCFEHNPRYLSASAAERAVIDRGSHSRRAG